MLQGIGRFEPKPGRVILPDVCCGISIVAGRTVVTGPMTHAAHSGHVGQTVVLLQIAPAAARRLLGAPISELTDRAIPLDEVDPKLACALAERFERGSLEALVRPTPPDAANPRFVAAARALAHGATVCEAAAGAGLSERQLERLMLEQAGVGPKLFARILRFRHTVVAAGAGASLAAAAAAHGYADQSHFVRDTRAFTGRTPGSLLPDVGNLQEVICGAL